MDWMDGLRGLQFVKIGRKCRWPVRLCGAAPALLATFWIPIEWSPGGFLSHYSGWLQRLASIYTATVEGAYMQGMAKRAAQQHHSHAAKSNM